MMAVVFVGGANLENNRISLGTSILTTIGMLHEYCTLEKCFLQSTAIVLTVCSDSPCTNVHEARTIQTCCRYPAGRSH